MPMKISSDPAVHRQREQRFLQHVQGLLNDDRLRVDTSVGHRAVTSLIREVRPSNAADALRRRMTELDLPDRELASRMPVGEAVEVTFWQKQLWFFRKNVGRMRLVCASPTDELLKGQDPSPMDTGDVSRALATVPPSLGGVPQTIVLMSTSGFTLEAHELADRRAERAVVLVEPNGAGGWTVTGPAETKNIADLFDPEAEAEKRGRVRAAIEEAKVDLLTGGIAVDRLAAKTKLPAPLVEAEIKNYAKANPGLVAKRLDGRFVLFREGSAPAATAAGARGASMPLIDRMRALFERKGDDEKKIAFLSERKAALSQQRDRAYEDMGALETQEEQLKRTFREAAGTITKKRVTSQLLQLRKDIERRQQLIGVLNQQVNVVATHLHNIELVQQGNGAQLPDTDEITADAVRAEEMLAELEANSELIGGVATSSGATGLNAEEQALYAELEAENKAAAAAPVAEAGGPSKAAAGKGTSEPTRERAMASTDGPPPLPTTERRRGGPEAG